MRSRARSYQTRAASARPSLRCMSARGMGEVVTVETALVHHRFDGSEACFGSVAHAKRGGAVQGPPFLTENSIRAGVKGEIR